MNPMFISVELNRDPSQREDKILMGKESLNISKS